MSSIKAVWVVGEFQGAQAKNVLESGDAGVGYFILDRGGKGQGLTCTAAFRKVVDGPLPHHLSEVKDPMKIQDYEQRRMSRQGIRPEFGAKKHHAIEIFPNATKI